jgi:hypothetical protein
MLALAVTVLAVSPSAAALADAGELRGALVRVDLEVQPQLPIAQMSREQLRAEYRRLDESRPGLGGPITAIALGGACIIGGLGTLWVSFILALVRAAPAVGVALGLGLLIGGGVLLTLGIVFLKLTIAERKPFGEAMDEIQQRLDGGPEQQFLPSPPNDPASPMTPPPPPPPLTGLGAVRPSVVVATF